MGILSKDMIFYPNCRKFIPQSGSNLWLFCSQFSTGVSIGDKLKACCKIAPSKILEAGL